MNVHRDGTPDLVAEEILTNVLQRIRVDMERVLILKEVTRVYVSLVGQELTVLKTSTNVFLTIFV